MVSQIFNRRNSATERVQKNTPSTHVLSIGILIVSVIILSIGLIIGMEFPKFVYNRMIEEQCVTNMDHKFYHKWQLEDDVIRYSKIYYWLVRNAVDVLLTGADPIVEEVGPYIYKEIRRKKDVVFSGAKVSFRYDVTYIFDPQRTQTECGGNCGEDDQLTVFQPYQLIEIFRSDGLHNFIFKTLAKALNENTQNRSLNRDNNWSLDPYGYLGCVSVTCSSYSSSNLTKHPVFGVWIQRNNTFRKNQFFSRNIKPYLSSQKILSFYRSFANESVFENQTLSSSCRNSFDLIFGSGSNIYDMGGNLTTGTSVAYVNYTFLKDFQAACGLLFILKMLNETKISLESNPTMTSLLMSYFCDSNDTNCLANLNFDEKVTIGYLMRDFINNELFQYAYAIIREYLNSTVIQTLSQRNIANGYFDSNDDVQSILKDTYTCKVGNSIVDVIWTVWTCLKDRDATNNLVISDIKAVCEDGTSEILLEQSKAHTDYVSAPVFCKACKPPDISQIRYDIFLEPLHRAYTFNSEQKNDDLGQDLYQLYLSKDEYRLQQDNYNCFLEDSTELKPYGSVYSNPHFFGCTSLQRYSLDKGNKNSHLSYILVEPISGRVWRKVTRLQENIYIPVLDNSGTERYVLVPFYWREDTVEVTKREIDNFKNKVTRLLNTACGGLIGLSTLAVVVFILSIAVIILPRRLNRVVPLVVEEAVPGRQFNLVQR